MPTITHIDLPAKHVPSAYLFILRVYARTPQGTCVSECGCSEAPDDIEALLDVVLDARKHIYDVIISYRTEDTDNSLLVDFIDRISSLTFNT